MKNEMFSKKTKIVATIGPATESSARMERLVRAGMNVARLNFSHGSHAEHAARIAVIRAIAKKLGAPIAILQDLSGPKIRIGDFYKERVILKKGSQFTLTTNRLVGDETQAFVNYPRLPKEVKPGHSIMLDDGKKRLRVLRTTATTVVCRVEVGGETKGRRGVNVPGAYLKISSITKKDRQDLAFGIAQQVDFVALSFVRSPKDVRELRALLSKHGSRAHIISKIETQEAIENIDDIIALSDGIMIARGDLAIEMPAQDVPILQKMIIKKCGNLGKPVITATQMLESMITSPVPTRAEVSDVANSIFDGTDAVMLSEETTLGQYPVAAVEMMARIARRAEGARCARAFEERAEQPIVDAITHSAIRAATETDAAALIALTESGSTARMISRWRPTQPIIALTPNEATRRRLALSFGCYPISIADFTSLKDVRAEAGRITRAIGIAAKGDRIVIAAGLPLGTTGSTNMMLVHAI